MKALRYLPLLLLLPALASAEELRGVVSRGTEPAPTAQNPDAKADVIYLTSGETRYRIVDGELSRELFWFNRRTVVLEGEVAPGSTELTVARVVQPAFQKNLQGILYRTKPGWSGSIRVDTNGTSLRATGPNYLTIRTATKDMKRRAVAFHGYVFEEAGDVIITHLKATAAERLHVTRGVILHELQQVPAGETVWVRRRGLVGATSEVETDQGVVGRVLTSRLIFGTVQGDDAEVPAPGQRTGVAGALERDR